MLLFLALPWVFVGLLTFVLLTFIWPLAQYGSVLGYILTGLLGLSVISFAWAAVTVSRDLLVGRFIFGD